MIDFEVYFVCVCVCVCNTGENDCPQNDTTEAVDACDENTMSPVGVSNDDTSHIQQSLNRFYVGISFVVFHLHGFHGCLKP